MSNLIEALKSWLLAAWDGLIDWTKTLDRATLAWGGLGLAAVILLSVNLLTSVGLRGVKADLTEDGLYTMSKGTRKILGTIDEPIDVRVYYSRKLGEVAPTYARYFERVRALLEQYRDISGGKLQLTFIDPEPFSDAEDRAVALGLRGLRLNADGELGYFGLSATNATDNLETIAHLAPDRDEFLEYDVTKLVFKLANPKKRVVGLITGLPLDGGTQPSMRFGGEPEQTAPWVMMGQIREFFEVRKLEEKLTEIPPDIDVLMVAQPTGLTGPAAYAIDQYALKGGKVLVFIDPIAEAAQLAMMQKGGEGRAKLANLLASWGVAFDPTKAAADIRHARRVQFGGAGNQGMVTEYVGWLTLDSTALDPNDVLASGIEILNFASAGPLSKVAGNETTFTPIVQTSADAMEIDARKLGMGADPLGLLKAYTPGGKRLTLAARVSGEAKTAYPDGPPLPDDAPKPKADGSADAGGDAAKEPVKEGDAKPADAAAGDKAGEKTGEAKPAEPKKELPASHVASGRINVIVVGDTDILHDRFWVDQRELMGQNVVTPTAHNAAFVIGALENLSGSDDLIALRSRGVDERPFTLVEELRRQSERRFREEEEGLTKKLQTLQEDLARLESAGNGNDVLVTDKDREAIEKFKTEMLETRRKLREVKLALRRDIDNLDAWLKFANIALVPILLGLGGLGWTWWQTRRRAGKSD